jgi:hypothetical protein
MASQFSFGGLRSNMNKENLIMDDHEPAITSTRNNKENIPPNDSTRPGRVFGQELGNIPNKSNLNQKITVCFPKN